MFKNLIANNQNNISGLFPIDEYLLDGIVILLENSRSMSRGIEYAHFDLLLWFNDFLSNYYTYINYVTRTPSFFIFDGMDEKKYQCEEIIFNSDEDLDTFFKKNEENTIVVYTIGKFISLKTLNTFYVMRYVDITHKRQKRDRLIGKIVESDTITT